MMTQSLEEFVRTATVQQIKEKFKELQGQTDATKHLELIIQTHIIVGNCEELAMAFPHLREF